MKEKTRRAKSWFQNPPWPRWAELPAAQGARRRRSRRSATPTTSNAARRSKSAQPSGLRRQAAVSGVAPPRRIAVDTPSSSPRPAHRLAGVAKRGLVIPRPATLGSGGLALATRLTRGFETNSKSPTPSTLHPKPGTVPFGDPFQKPGTVPFGDSPFHPSPV